MDQGSYRLHMPALMSYSKKLRNILSVSLLMVAMHLHATHTPLQKARMDFKKVNDLYLGTASYSLDIQYAVYDNHAGGNMVEQKSGKYIKSQDMSYSRILNIETAINPKTTVVVNHEDKAIVITDTRKISLSPLQTNVDTLLSFCSSIKVQDIGVTERHYTLNFSEDENSEFLKIELAINLSNYSIKKMVLYYNQEMPLTENDYYALEKKPRLEITYKAFTPTSSSNPALFAESTYLSQANTVYKGKGKYAAYTVINQLQSARLKKK